MAFTIVLFLLPLGSVSSSCFFPVEMQGEFMTQWLQSAEIRYTSMSILYDSIPGWGACHSRAGEQVILRQGETCYRCISLVQRSPAVQQLHTREVGQCHPTPHLARESCPREEERATRQVTEMMLYKTRGFYGEAAASAAHCPITGRHTVEEECGGEERPSPGEASTCPSEGRLSLRLGGCSAPRSLELQCLGHWRGEDGHKYLALLDMELPQLGEEPRARYRCAIYTTDGPNTRLALSNDSTCVHQLESERLGAEVFALRKVETRRPRSRGQRLPAWAQGQWEEVKVEGAAITYRDSANQQTIHLRTIASPAKGRFVVSVDSECGEVGGFTCLSLHRRTKGVMEMMLAEVVGSVREASVLCAMETLGTWVTVTREGHSEACPLPGTFTGVIPDSRDGLCATSSTSCSSPDTMTYQVFSCSNRSEVYEERTYQCRGQFTEGGLTYTLTRRLDLPLQECFVGLTDGGGRSHRVMEAGAHCSRGKAPSMGMLMERMGEEGEHCTAQMEEQVVLLRGEHRPSHPLYHSGRGEQGEQEEEREVEVIRVLDIQLEEGGHSLPHHSGTERLAVSLLLTLLLVASIL